MTALLMSSFSSIAFDQFIRFWLYTKMCTVDKISGFQSLTYLPTCMGSHHLARDIEYPPHLLVTEEVKKLFDREKVIGVRLVRPEDYYGPLREI